METQRASPNRKVRNSEDIDGGSDRANEKADGEDSDEDSDDSALECDFDLTYAETDEEQPAVLSEKTIRTCLIKRMANKNFM